MKQDERRSREMKREQRAETERQDEEEEKHLLYLQLAIRGLRGACAAHQTQTKHEWALEMLQADRDTALNKK